MRTQRKNKQTMKYATLKGKEVIYKLDDNGDKIVDYVDDEGTVYYLTIGEKVVYNEPIEMTANISLSRGEVETAEFGIDVSGYDATVVFDLGKYPIEETTIIWHESEPKFDEYGYVDPASADYKVLMVKPSLNYTKLLLGRLVKTIV